MPPKCKFTRDEVVRAALDMTRESGIGSVTARRLGEKLGSSSRPIFSLFRNMQEVQGEVIQAADELYQEYLRREMSAGEYPAYKASGIAYIRFAREERELFRLLFMRDRSAEEIDDNPKELKPIIDAVTKSTGLPEQLAYLFHLEMWVYVHGIATMIATSYLEWQWDTVSQMLTDGFMGLKKRYEERTGNYGSDQNGGNHKKI